LAGKIFSTARRPSRGELVDATPATPIAAVTIATTKPPTASAVAKIRAVGDIISTSARRTSSELKDDAIQARASRQAAEREKKAAAKAAAGPPPAKLALARVVSQLQGRREGPSPRHDAPRDRRQAQRARGGGAGQGGVVACAPPSGCCWALTA
jgi:hypothetical protein